MLPRARNDSALFVAWLLLTAAWIAVLIGLVTLTGCSVAAAPSAAPSPTPVLSCTLATSSPTEQIFQFSDPDTAAPVGTECVSLGGGWFTCTPDACLVLPYTGTCPHCGGGGE